MSNPLGCGWRMSNRRNTVGKPTGFWRKHCLCGTVSRRSTISTGRFKDCLFFAERANHQPVGSKFGLGRPPLVGQMELRSSHRHNGLCNISGTFFAINGHPAPLSLRKAFYRLASSLPKALTCDKSSNWRPPRLIGSRKQTVETIGFTNNHQVCQKVN